MHTLSPPLTTQDTDEQPNAFTWTIDGIGFTRAASTSIEGFTADVDVKPDPLGWVRYGIHQLGQFSKVQLHGAIRHFPLANDLLDDATWFIPATRYEDLVAHYQADNMSLPDAQRAAQDLINREYQDAAHYGRDWNYVTVTVRLSVDGLTFEPVHMNGLRSDDAGEYFDLVASELIETALAQAKSRLTGIAERLAELLIVK